jgi:uncharacterized membrane protein (UPF0136 family)
LDIHVDMKKGGSLGPAYPINLQIGARGFEPPASCAQGRRATKLRYAPINKRFIVPALTFRFNSGSASVCRYNAVMGIVLIVYALIILIGGVVGFRLAGSRASLMMGFTTGLMLAVSGALVLLGNKSGAYYGLGVNMALVLVFGSRYLRTMKMVPAGLMLGASVIVAAILYAQLFT